MEAYLRQTRHHRSPGRDTQPDASVAQPACDGGGGDDGRGMAGRAFHLENGAQGRKGCPRGPAPGRDSEGGGLHDVAELG